jgi:hypothetical protein
MRLLLMRPRPAPGQGSGSHKIVFPFRQVRFILITIGYSMLALTVTVPPSLRQVSMSM